MYKRRRWSSPVTSSHEFIVVIESIIESIPTVNALNESGILRWINSGTCRIKGFCDCNQRSRALIGDEHDSRYTISMEFRGFRSWSRHVPKRSRELRTVSISFNWIIKQPLQMSDFPPFPTHLPCRYRKWSSAALWMPTKRLPRRIKITRDIFSHKDINRQIVLLHRISAVVSARPLRIR